MHISTARQKTLSVKWHQSANEMRSNDKPYLETRRIRETALRNRPELPKLNNSNEYYSRQESLATASTPLMKTNTSNATDNTIYMYRDCSMRNSMKIP